MLTRHLRDQDFGSALSRARFLKAASFVTGGSALLLAAAACSPPAAVTPAPSAPSVAPTTIPPSPVPSAAPSVAPTTASSPAATTASAPPVVSGSASPTVAATVAASLSTAQRVVTVGDQNDFGNLDVQLSSNTPDSYFFDNIYDYLVFQAPGAKIVPGLATEWKQLESKTWQFKLRPGVKWHNGDPFTSADVKFTFDRMKDPATKSVYAGLYKSIATVTALDPMTVNIATQDPDPLLPSRLAVHGGFIIPEKYVKQVGPDAFANKPNGTGPFRFVEWVKTDHVTIEANPIYWGDQPNATRVTFKNIPEDAARVAALVKGEVNLIDNLPPDQIATLNSGGVAQLVADLADFPAVLILNTNVPPLDNKLVRQAMSLAIDRQGLVTNLLAGQPKVLNGFVCIGDFGYDPNRPPLPYDPKKAADLVKQSGYKGDVIHVEARTTEKSLDEAIVSMWKSVGLNADVIVIEPAVRVQEVNAHSIKGALWYGAGSPFGDADGVIYSWLGPGASGYYWHTAEYDQLIQQSHVETDQNKRYQMYQQLEKIVDDNVPFITLYQPAYLYGVGKSLKWQPSPGFRLDFAKKNLSFVS